MNKEYNNYNKPELKVLFWNVLADVYLKYYDTRVKELSPTYNLDFKLRPIEANYTYRQERIMKYIKKMSPDVIGLVEIQDTMYEYLKEKLDEYYNFTEIISDELDQDKIDYNFPLEGKCIIYKKSLEITNINLHALETGYGRKALDFKFNYADKSFSYIVHHNSPVYLIAVDKDGNYLNPKDEEYEKKFNDKNKEPDMNQIVEIYPGKYKKFMRGNAIFCMENLIKYINENISSNTILLVGGDFNSQPSYPPKVLKSHIPEYIEKIKFDMVDLHDYRNDKSFLSTKHDGRRFDYIFYDKSKLKPKYIQHIQPPVFDMKKINKGMSHEEIDEIKIFNRKIWKMNYSYQLMNIGSDHQPIYSKFIIM